ncbi:Hpt domain-containing protein [Sphingomonas turrisvirgatae]|uniref:Histidine phosphotransferase n=1 Tax=Sphingomonas turrisvirgatae TaxID=1888892 RepID=A0A1E3LUH1_9SPHN|nr:Hpt domain-containing protein [Sphingomonas turrisvirgatae]ODP37411.1 histidine phosphotransferase [Sphingomonas turrisvirgatae]
MATYDMHALVDWRAFSQARAELGANFVRILGYFAEDGVKSLERIEDAMRNGNAASLVIPAHTLKGEAHQFGAEPLAECAAAIEAIGRHCVENRYEPSEALEHVVQLRPLFNATLALLEREANPLVDRRQGFGRRVG